MYVSPFFPEFIHPVMDPFLGTLLLYDRPLAESDTRPCIQVIPDLCMCLIGIVCAVKLYADHVWLHWCNGCDESWEVRDIGICSSRIHHRQWITTQMHDMCFIHLYLIVGIVWGILVLPRCFPGSGIDDANRLTVEFALKRATGQHHDSLHTIHAKTVFHKVLERCRVG